MEENPNLFESLIESVTEYGKTSIELAKLKALDKTSDVVSTIIPHSFIIALIATFILFLNLGLAFWLGDILGKTYYGFFVVAAFYLLIGAIIYFFMYKWLKKIVCDIVIKKLLK
jgi:hypothetical protein